MRAALSELASSDPRGMPVFDVASSQGQLFDTSTGETEAPWSGWIIRFFRIRAVGPDASNLGSISTETLNNGSLASSTSYVVDVGYYDQLSASSASSPNRITLTSLTSGIALTNSTSAITLTGTACGSNQALEGSWHTHVYQTLAGEGIASAATIVEALGTPVDALIAELEELRELPEDWDGEEAAAPIPDAIDDAISFVRAARDLANRLEPTPDVDGSILLEFDVGGAGSLRFKGDHSIIHAIRGVAPGTVGFDGITVPNEISEALAAL
jgi:hypothetical protein